MVNRILWSISATLFVFGVGFIAKDYLNFTKFKQVSGVSVSEPAKLGDDFYNVIKKPVKKENAKDPQVFANVAYLMDYSTSYPMYGQNENQKVPIASTTKMATAIVVLENHSDKLNDIVTITPQMIAVAGSDIKLLSGEKISVDSLLKGLLIMSGNDTAFALASYFGGKEAFVNEMNDKMRQIGAYDTQYKDPAGLDDEGYSTAHDLAVIAAYALKNQQFAEIVRTPETSISSSDGRIVHDLKNSNRMVRQEEQLYYPNAIGIKTGFTNDAGHVLVSCAQKDNHKILAVILNTQENSLTASAKESKKLLEWGFDNWQW